MKKLRLIAALGIICILLMGAAPEDLQPTSRFFVNDFADVLDEEDEDAIYQLGVSLFEQTKAQAVVVTVPSMDGMDLESFSYTLAESWGIGDEEDDSGVLLLLALEERESRIEVGYGLEGALTDLRTGQIQDKYMLPYYRDGDYSTGMLEGYKAVLSLVYDEYGIEVGDELPSAEEVVEEDNDIGNLFTAFIPFLVIFGIIAISAIVARRPWRSRWGRLFVHAIPSRTSPQRQLLWRRRFWWWRRILRRRFFRRRRQLWRRRQFSGILAKTKSFLCNTRQS